MAQLLFDEKLKMIIEKQKRNAESLFYTLSAFLVYSVVISDAYVYGTA